MKKTATGTGKYELLLKRCRALKPVPTAVAHPCGESALAAAVQAGRKNLFVPILPGPAARIARTAKSARIHLGGMDVVGAPHSHDAAEKAVGLVREGRAEVLMKGSLHSVELLSAIVSREGGDADRPPHQPPIPHGRPLLPQGPPHHGRRDQHRPRPPLPAAGGLR